MIGNNNGADTLANDADLKQGDRPAVIEQQPMSDISEAGPVVNEVIDSVAVRPVFLGNLDIGVRAEDVGDLFHRPVVDVGAPIVVDRIDIKKGFCFVFLRDAKSQSDKDRIERYVHDITGMEIARVSKSLRAEFARGDGRIKQKEDDRRKRIIPNETLFVVNFHEETTKKEDLEMLFSPHGQLMRIDMRKNYAFVQFTKVEDATKAKEATNGGKLDQSVITVEYVAQRDRGVDRDRRDRSRDRGYRGRSYEYGRDDRHDGYRGGRRSPPRERYDDYRRGRSRSRSPVYRYRSRSRSPRREPIYRYRSRSRSPRRDYRDVGRGRSSDRDYRGDDVRGGRGRR